jgi:small subunit ribosomal protein S17
MKIISGKVIAQKMPKTATVEVVRTVVHPLYQKRVRKTRKYQVHDEVGVKLGQMVKFVASRPYSKLKKWRIIK